jgi:hypothetical protein
LPHSFWHGCLCSTSPDVLLEVGGGQIAEAAADVEGVFEPAWLLLLDNEEEVDEEEEQQLVLGCSSIDSWPAPFLVISLSSKANSKESWLTAEAQLLMVGIGTL